MRKVAICFGGESKNFNQLAYYDIKKLTDILSLRGFEFDYYGHTWDHCELPDTNLLNFKGFKQESQKIIDNWVMEEFVTRAFFDRKYWKPISDPTELVDFHLKFSRDRYGQLVSSYASLCMPNPDNYDLIIRARWDCKFDIQNDYEIEILLRGMNSLVELNNENQEARCLAPSDTKISPRDWSKRGNRQLIILGDFFFVFNKLAAYELQKNTSFELIEKINSIIPKTHHNLGGHQLWAEALGSCAFQIDTLLPNIFEVYRIQDQDKNNPMAWTKTKYAGGNIT